MILSSEQVEELKPLCTDVRQGEEGGRVFSLLLGLCLPTGCVPERTDALLCPTGYDGYPFRLFFAERVESRLQLNWNVSGVRILERNWHAFSWKVSPETRLIQMVAVFLRAFK